MTKESGRTDALWGIPEVTGRMKWSAPEYSTEDLEAKRKGAYLMRVSAGQDEDQLGIRHW